MNDEQTCRQAFDDFYHKIKAEVSYDHWRAIWRFISKRQVRGEPVAWLRSDELRKLGHPYSDAPLNSKTDSMMLHAKGTQEAAAKYGHDVPVFTAPQPQQIPEGYKIVPIEPTEEMIEAADRTFVKTGHVATGKYKAMLEAAPEPKENP